MDNNFWITTLLVDCAYCMLISTVCLHGGLSNDVLTIINNNSKVDRVRQRSLTCGWSCRLLSALLLWMKAIGHPMWIVMSAYFEFQTVWMLCHMWHKCLHFVFTVDSAVPKTRCADCVFHVLQSLHSDNITFRQFLSQVITCMKNFGLIKNFLKIGRAVPAM